MSRSESGFIDVEGGRLYFEADGEGTPITLIHAGVAHVRMWDEQVTAWRDRHLVIRYDTRGFGRTITEDMPYSNRDDLRAVLDYLGVEGTHLVGLSRGAMIATDFTVENPERIKSLTWVAGGLRGFEVEDPRLTDLWAQMEALEEGRDWNPLVELETKLWVDGFGEPEDRVDPEVRRKMIQWNLENYLADQQANQPIQPESPAAEHLDVLTMPTLFMWGTLDELGVIRSGEKLSAEVEGARSKVFEGVAHMVNLERPEEFNRIVGEFVDEVDASS